jgi:hypothetical protein
MVRRPGPNGVSLSDTSDNRSTEAQSASSQDTDVLFRMQVAAGEWFARNWKHGIPLIGLALLGSLAYGAYTSWNNGRIEAGFESVARIDHKMPQTGPFADPTRASDYDIGAGKYLEAASSASGAPAVVAYLKAAEAFSLAGKKAEARAALEKAVAVKAEGLVRYSAEMALNGARLDAGEVEAALAAYRDMAGRYEGFYARSALEALATAQDTAGKTEDAKATRAEIATRFSGAAAAAAPLAADAPASVAPAAPAESPAAPSGAAPAAGTGTGG